MRARRLAACAALGLLAASGLAAKPARAPVPASLNGDAQAIDCGPRVRSWLAPFASAPFPFDGAMPDGTPFYDRPGPPRGHTSPRGGVYPEAPTYQDSRVLLSVPGRSDSAAPPVIVVYLHGNQATLARDVCRRQRIPAQVAEAGRNAVLVAPQLAVDALDSSAGTFWRPGQFRAFLDEAAATLAALTGQDVFRSAPVIVVAYSGGYLPAVYAAQVGGIGSRLVGLVLMDALFGEVERYAAVLGERRLAFASAYSPASREQNASLRAMLRGRLDLTEGLPRTLGPGTAAFEPGGSGATHGDFMTRALGGSPLTAVLRRFPAIRRAGGGPEDR